MESENQALQKPVPAPSASQPAPAPEPSEPAPPTPPDQGRELSNQDRIVIILCGFVGAAVYAVARALFVLSGFSLPLPGGLVGAFLVGGNAGALIAKGKEGLRWIYLGPQGLRAGWSVLIFFLFFVALSAAIDTALDHFHLFSFTNQLAPGDAFFAEAGGLLSLLIAVALVGLIEGRRILAYNLTGPRRPQHFVSGLAAGFLALSVLIAALAAGGWLHFGPVALSGAAIFRFGLMWGCVFLVSATVEEGMFRCYGLFTLTRGLNFWWALGIVALLCADLASRHGSAAWGVYAAALLGLFPCLTLHQKAAPHTGFWCAAWVTSTLFGFSHVTNPGENWVGILAASFIGFVFCVSVRVTGSAWWAIGFHAAWDWAETFFYGAADSGMQGQGRYLTANPAGNPLWSGGADGPEGSLLVLGVILLLLVALLLMYGPGKLRAQHPPAAEEVLG